VVFLRLLPIILSAFVLGAHFLRNGHGGLLLLCVAMVLSLAVRRTWVITTTRVFLVLGTLEWLRTLVMLAHVRIAYGEPWGRLAAILGGVALATAASALVLRSARVREYYGGRSSG